MDTAIYDLLYSEYSPANTKHFLSDEEWEEYDREHEYEPDEYLNDED